MREAKSACFGLIFRCVSEVKGLVLMVVAPIAGQSHLAITDDLSEVGCYEQVKHKELEPNPPGASGKIPIHSERAP